MQHLKLGLIQEGKIQLTVFIFFISNKILRDVLLYQKGQMIVPSTRFTVFGPKG